jgi:hypothetical protein
MTPRLALQEEKIRDFCRRHHVRKMSLFGSVLRDDFRPSSDVDVLVDFDEGHVPGLEFVRMMEELSKIFDGRRVDLVTPRGLHPLLRERVLSSAAVVYGA